MFLQEQQVLFNRQGLRDRGAVVFDGYRIHLHLLIFAKLFLSFMIRMGIYEPWVCWVFYGE